ncbi:hypothetical protein ACFSTC_54370 [Nonomuraea ferruginea]
MELRVGDLVEVRGREEILATLDERGELENLPFMPEMLRYCGRRLTVHKVAHKLCDTISRSGMRKMERAVHLTGARCDGAAHGGCQTACSLYWKEAWLRKVEPGDPPRPAASSPRLLPLLQVNTRKGADAYSCQATELLRAAPTCLPFRDLGQYVTDVRSGNAGAPAVARAFLVGLFNRFQEASKKILPRRLWIRRGLRWGVRRGAGLAGPRPPASSTSSRASWSGSSRRTTSSPRSTTACSTGGSASRRRWPATAAAPPGCAPGWSAAWTRRPGGCCT